MTVRFDRAAFGDDVAFGADAGPEVVDDVAAGLRGVRTKVGEADFWTCAIFEASGFAGDDEVVLEVIRWVCGYRAGLRLSAEGVCNGE